jgi:hypothetical protein
MLQSSRSIISCAIRRGKSRKKQTPLAFHGAADERDCRVHGDYTEENTPLRLNELQQQDQVRLSRPRCIWVYVFVAFFLLTKRLALLDVVDDCRRRRVPNLARREEPPLDAMRHDETFVRRLTLQHRNHHRRNWQIPEVFVFETLLKRLVWLCSTTSGEPNLQSTSWSSVFEGGTKIKATQMDDQSQFLLEVLVQCSYPWATPWP